MADCHGAATDLNIADWFLPRLHAVQEIGTMIVAFVEADRVVRQWFLTQLSWCSLELAAVNQDLAFGADEKDAATVAVDHFHSICIQIAKTSFSFRILGWNDFHRPAVIHAQSPLSDIEMVGAPIGHHAA